MNIDSSKLAQKLPKAMSGESPLLMSLLFYNSKISLKLKLIVERAVHDAIQNYIESEDRTRELEEIVDELISQSENIIITNCTHIYDSMVIDRVGIPLLNNDPLKTIWYGAPHFETTYLTCLTESKNNDRLDALTIERHMGKSCFNCDGIDHELSKCPIPKDFARINAKRNEFLSSTSFSAMNPNDLKYRYHDDLSKQNPYSGCEAGKISKELRDALNLEDDELPLYIYRMRVFGYPLGYMQNYTQHQKIDMIGNEFSAPPNDEEAPLADTEERKEIIYPGFNAPLPEGVYDEGPRLGYPPIKRFKHKKEVAMSIEIVDIEHPSSPEIIYLDDNLTTQDYEYSVNHKRQRRWFIEPLAIKMFAPKPTWRRPPMLKSNDPYKDPEIDSSSLQKGTLIQIDPSCLIFDDQCIPTERLQHIQNILQKRNEKIERNKRKKRKI